MNYDLAKELMEAGFPQGCLPFFCDGCKKAQHNDEGIDMCDCEVNKYTQTYIPTLSELIEACGECFVVLKAVHDMNQWIASDALYDSGKLGLIGIGSSPESAVANLWLALNRKEV